MKKHLIIKLMHSSLYAVIVLFASCASANSAVYRFTEDVNHPLSGEQRAESEAIIKILENIHGAILQNNLAILTDYINKDKGLYIDLKAHKSAEEVALQIKDENSYLNIFFLNTKKLRKTTEDKNQISIKDILSGENNVQVELFFNEKNDECEAKLILQKNKNLNYRLNNPYFIKIKSKWYLYRLM